MAEGPYLLGVDYGTESCRVGIFQADGTPLALASQEHALHHPRPGWAEQDPDQWWAGLVAACNHAMRDSGVSPDAIAGMAVDATSATVLAVDANGRHLRPAIMWMDLRATDEANEIEQSGHRALKYNGQGPVPAEWGLPKVMWLRRHEPEVYDNAAHIVDATDWLVNKLTGEWAGTVNIAAGKYYHDRDIGGFPQDLLDNIGLDGFVDKYPQPIVDITHVTGELTGPAAHELGLRAGIPVAQGGMDGYMGALGLGVVAPGSMAMITGSSHAMIGQAADPIYGRGFYGAFTDALIPGAYTVEAGQSSSGSIVAWFKNRFAGDIRVEAEQRGVGIYDLLNERASDVPIGSDGLICLDYFQGNRSPYTDPLARGMLWGLTLSHTPGHVFRAIIEGICFGTENILREMRDDGYRPNETIVAGGPTNSKLWMQMHADVSNVPLSITRTGAYAPVVGSAMCAAVGAGVHPDLQTAAEEMIEVERTIEPDEKAHERYQFYFERYVRGYHQMKA
jgi:ribulokinase